MVLTITPEFLLRKALLPLLSPSAMRWEVSLLSVFDRSQLMLGALLMVTVSDSSVESFLRAMTR